MLEKQQDTEKLQNSESETQASRESYSGKQVERINIEGTPFHLVLLGEENKGFIACGDKRLSEITEDITELKNQIENKDWNLIVSIINIIFDWRNK